METEQSPAVSYAIKLRHIRALLAKSQEFQDTFYSVKKAGLDIDVFKNVFSPGYFDDSEYFATHLPDVADLAVLEIGTGTGLIALKCALGKARKVVATDINPEAVTNAKQNVKLHQMESVVDVLAGDIFKAIREDPIQRDQKFDLIFWNIPFCYLNTDLKSEIGLTERITALEKSVFNPFYNYLYVYLNEGFDYLTEKGRLLLGFSPTIGRAERLDDIAYNLSLAKTILVEDTIEIEGSSEKLQLLEFTKSK